jgi:two-component system cell cycle sensor histidine kinase/response regulator CckA
VIDSNKNIISYSHLLNEFLEPQTKTISEALTSESWLKLQDQQNQLPELVFKKNQDNTFVTSHSTTIGSFSCLYLFNITRYKSLEMHMAHSQKMQAVGQLAGGISHDFNNLLTAILGFCDLLLMKHPAGDPSFAEIMQIKQNSNRAANLVRQLLALSRKQVLKPKIIDLSETIAELANLIRRLIGENIELDIIYSNNLKPIKVDQGQLEQVIINLVVNARDAIFKYKTGKGKITLSTKNVVIKSESDIDKKFKSPEGEKILPGEYVVISVIDNGIGIPQNIINKIFEPFFSTKALGAGTGLGLSTVYSILKQAGGMIYLASQENHGTIFDIYLKAEQTNIVEKEETNMELSLVTKDLTGNATILLVEDEIPVRMFCTHALTNKGHKIIEATSGEEALEIFNKNKEKIDLIISDVIMPGITGPALIAEIRKTNPNVKVIFMSGYAEEAFSKENDLQDFHFLSKPFTLNQLAKTVKDVLSLESV